MPTADEELIRIEESVDWPALIEKALADPPIPSELFNWLSKWAIFYDLAHKRKPLEADLPDGVNNFFRSLAFATIPPEVKDWVYKFERKHNRMARSSDLPAAMQKLMPKSDRPKGRSRCDVLRMRNAAIAWVREGLKEDSSALALQKLEEETGMSIDYLSRILYPRKKLILISLAGSPQKHLTKP